MRILSFSDHNDLDFNTFDHCTETGILIETSDNITLTNNTIVGNTVGITQQDKSPDNEAHANDIYDNSQYGIEVIGDPRFTFNATGNWWGSHTGPHHEDTNPDGEGNEVTDHVIFDPWKLGGVPPVATIVSITPNPADEGEEITFIGEGQDDGTIVAYRWTSNISGTFYEGPDPQTITSTLPPGEHDINLTVRDDVGLWSLNVNRTLIINEQVVNNKPEVSFTSPAGGAEVRDTVTFQGTVTDLDGLETITSVEVRIPGAGWTQAVVTDDSWQLSWDSNAVTDGEYEVLVKAKDDLEYSERDSITIEVDNDDEDEDDHWTDICHRTCIASTAFVTVVGVVFQRRKSSYGWGLPSRTYEQQN